MSLEPVERAKQIARLIETYGGDFESASTILAEALKRVQAQRDLQAEQVRTLEEDLATARLFYSEAVIAERELIRLLDGGLFTAEFQDPQAVDDAEVRAWVRALNAKYRSAEDDGLMDPLDILAWETAGLEPVPSWAPETPPPPPEPPVEEPAPTKRTRAGRKGHQARISGRKALAVYKERRGLH